MLALLLAAALAAPPKLALPGLKCSDVKPGVADALSEHLAQQLGARGLSVISAADVGAVIGLERQKVMMGCAEDNCVAELAGALGVDALVTGSVAHVGNTYLVNVRVIGAKDAKPVSTWSETVPDEGAIPAALERAAGHLATDLGATPQRSGSRLFLVPIGLGAASLAGAGVAFGVAASATSKLSSTMNAPADFDALALKQQGNSAAYAAYALCAIGALALVGGVLWWLLGGDR